MSALDAILAYERALADQDYPLIAAEVWLHQDDGIDLLEEIVQRRHPMQRVSLMSDPAPCFELVSGLRVFARIMSQRRRDSLARMLRGHIRAPYVWNTSRSYRIYGRRQPRAGWMHTGRAALALRCTVHEDCRRSRALGYACLASAMGDRR